ncbi:amidohydrolase family protein [Dyadobacter tibetensis]|uniref:amidohydrolase family protein n=1 Tax=Dyadobacter tibetensis TaxID=1211851 RepID=UPI000470153D|nr:amidohydrolase family protein [Dyadobacter tibetensis]
MLIDMLKLVVLSIVFFLVSLPFHLQAQITKIDSIPVRFEEGTNMALALSPDKKTVAIDLQGTIWLVPVEGGEGIAITDALGDCRLPTWSPDGNWIAFQSYRDGNYHIWQVNRSGLNLQQLTFGVFHDREPEYAPDGKTIVFSSDRGGSYDLWTVELSNKSLKQLTSKLANEYYPSLSHDGSRLIYVSDDAQAPGLYVRDDKGITPILITKNKIHAPVWNIPGTHILYTELTASSSILKKLELAGKQIENLTATKQDVFPYKVSWLTPTDYLFTADGKIYQGSISHKEQIEIPFHVSVELARHQYIIKKRLFGPGSKFPVKGLRAPSLSPDGSKLVFTALGDIWLLTLGNPTPERVTNDSFVALDPAWSPDGRSIAYTSDKNGEMNIWQYDFSTHKESVLVSGHQMMKFPSWSPDGQHLAYYQAESDSYSKYTLMVWNKATNQSMPVTDGIFEGSQPTWFAETNHVAFSTVDPFSTRFREGLNKVSVYNLSGELLHSFSPVPEKSLGTRGKNGPIIAPDGNRMAFIMDNLLWVIPLDENKQVSGPPICLSQDLAESPSWSADSRYIVFLSTDVLKRVEVETGILKEIPLKMEWEAKVGTEDMVIHAGRVFDGLNDRYLLNQDVVVKGNRIVSIAPHQEGQSGKLIDASDLTLMPGLIEMHTHQSAYLGEKGGRLWLAYGITSIREPGTEPYDALERKEAWDSGRRLGPRTFFTGGHMEGNRVYYNRNTSNVGGAQLELELKRASTLGYDMIKTYVGLSDILQKRVTDFAHENGMSVSSHEIYPAAGFGVDAVEHMGATSRRGFSPKLSSLNHSYQDFVTIIAKSGMNITPTISLHGGYLSLIRSDTSFFNHVQFKTFYPENLRLRWTEIAGASGERLATYKNIENTLVTLFNEGARVTPGTDSPILPSGLSYHAELQSWIKAGISNFQTLRAATAWAAQAIGVGQDLGTVEPEKLADLVIVEGDPLQNIQDLLNVKAVIKNGVYLDQERLLRK